MVLKSNKGPVNQRLVTSSYDNFTEIFGEPENLDDYGHFAAENYLAISNQLMTVRATMGDENYAQIQYPYTDADADDTFRSLDTAEISYVNQELDNKLTLLQSLDTVTTVSALTESGAWLTQSNDPVSAFYLNQRAGYSTIVDLINDNPPSVAVWKNIGKEDEPIKAENIVKDEGKYVEFVSKTNANGDVLKWYDDLIFNNNSWASGKFVSESFDFNNNPITTYVSNGESEPILVKGYRTQFSIPSSATLNGSALGLTAYFTEDFKNLVTSAKTDPSIDLSYSAVFQDENFYHGTYSATESEYVKYEDACKIQIVDWDDCITKTYYVNKEYLDKTTRQAVGLKYREFGYNDQTEVLAGLIDDEAITTARMDTLDFDKINSLADEYGCDPSEISTKDYLYLTYYPLWEGIQFDPNDEDMSGDPINEPVEKIIYAKEWADFVNSLGGDKLANDYLFYTLAEKNAKKATTVSVFVANKPNMVVIPWQDGLTKTEDSEPITKLAAFSTTEILNGTNEKYRDGYTLTIESDDEPGNGDIEEYVSNKANQLIIAAIGPGEYGNDIGVSIITTACASIPALNHQNAFDWKYRYDDEDQVDANADNLTWEKVYRINVYVKPKTQTAQAAWGTGMDALLKDPIEWFYVSNDPTAKDNEGNSLFAPNVINGHSKYIYVSRASVNDARTGAGTYAQPCQTYSIYSLTGGSNSKKNNMNEKTVALKLYKDRQKASFDILFNADAVETFNGRQRYGAFQRKLAEIAGNRTMDIAVVQVTSKEAKSIRTMMSEAKMFAFNNGTYVAPYANYDKYYNATLASWIYLPKSVAGACAMAYCDMYAYPWFAPAGASRGSIQYTTGQLVRLTDDEIGQLYSINVNTSRMSGEFGEILWGQKTALKKDSALNRINVRRCLNFIEKSLEMMLVPYLFQQNTANTRSAARNSIDAFLNRVKSAEGLEEYRLSVTQDSQDPHIMNVAIRVIPAEALEFVDVTITIDRQTGISTSETFG